MLGTKPTALAAAVILALFLGSTATAEPQDDLLRQSAPTTHEFQITLIRARPGQLSLPDLPSDALEVLDDIAHVLPYQDFELIDVGWMRTHRQASVRMGEAASFEAYLEFQDTAEAQYLLVYEFGLTQREFERDGEGRVHYGGTETLLSSSFGITVGETVVVGTSRLNGPDKEALIVLLKAVR